MTNTERLAFAMWRSKFPDPVARQVQAGQALDDDLRRDWDRKKGIFVGLAHAALEELEIIIEERRT
ncbi:hypothetical protein [Roseibium sp.]|uniref:hypothetical protein n=1 Tax=Roseibium sp. TaxID=1936156 RepID=UPI003263B037